MKIENSQDSSHVIIHKLADNKRDFMARYNRITQLLLVILTLIIYAISVQAVLTGRGGDFEFHIVWAQQAVENSGRLPVNPLYPILVIILSFLLPTADAFIRSGYLVAVTFHVITGLVLYRLYIRPVLGNPKNYTQVFLAVFLVLSLLLMSAITIFTLPAHNLFWGYVVPIVYHNSNIILLRAFGLILFFRILMAWDDTGDKASTSAIIFTAIVTVLSLLSRPQHLIALLPALVLIFVWKFWRKSYQDWKHLLLGVIVPASLTIFLQLLLQPYSQADGTNGHIGILPFALVTYIPSSVPLIPKYLLSITFPLIVYISYWRKSRAETALNFAWLAFFISNFFMYFVVEMEKITHFNFIPTSQIAIFILYVISMRFFLKKIHIKNQFVLKHKEYLIIGVFVLHVVSGLVWYLTEMILSTDARWW